MPNRPPRNDLKAELVRRGITQTELAKLIHKSRVYVGYMLNGQRTLPMDVAELIAFKTGIPLPVILADPEREEAAV